MFSYFAAQRALATAIVSVSVLAGTWSGSVPATATGVQEPGATTLVAISASGLPGGRGSSGSSLSADGRFVAFGSDSRLVPTDFNGVTDIYVRDRVAGFTELVSVRTDGIQGNYPSYHPSISADGRYVAFESRATNFVSSDRNGCADIFVRDRLLGITERVSVNDRGIEGDRCSIRPTISGDGRYIAFHSLANNLVEEDTNREFDVFVRDRFAMTTERISVAAIARQLRRGVVWRTSAISSDGRYVAFVSAGAGVVPGDTNGTADVFVRDRVRQATELISAAGDGQPGGGRSSDPAISADGRYVTFRSRASDLVGGDTNAVIDVFVRDREAETTSRVSVATDGRQAERTSFHPVISADGRYVAFASDATTLTPPDTNNARDVFVRDLWLGLTRLVSVSTAGLPGDDSSSNPALSADGRTVAFDSQATNLVSADPSKSAEVFARQLIDHE